MDQDSVFGSSEGPFNIISVMEGRIDCCFDGAADEMGDREDDGANIIDGDLGFDGDIDHRDDIEGADNV